MTSPEFARDALLGQIVRLTESDVLDPDSVLKLAEAYAWIIDPHRTRGGRPEQLVEEPTEKVAEQGVPSPG